MKRSVALLLVAAGSSLCYDITCDSDPGERAAMWKGIAAKLSAEYEIEEGVMHFKGTEFYGGNPSTEYGRYYAGPDIPGVQEGWMLGEQDAIVFFGCTPPPGRYFSWRSYVFFSPKPEPAMLFASLGDSAHHLIFNTTKTAQAPFNSTSVVITTADYGTYHRVSTAFPPQYVDAVNLDAIPSSLVKMGKDLITDDWFTMLVRFAMPQSKAAGDTYLNATFPIYRLRQRIPSTHVKEPIPVIPLKNRTMAESEAQYDGSVSEVKQSVVAKLASMGFKLKSSDAAEPFDINGYVCIQKRTNCIGDNHDAAYLKQNQSTGHTLGADDILVVMGVNHHTAGTGVYSNVAMYRYPAGSEIPPEAVPISVTDEKYQGSAAFYSPNTADASKLYSYAFSRSCPEQLTPYCTNVTVADVPMTDAVLVANRDYLNPGTKTGPGYDQLFMPLILLFSKN